MKNKLLSAILSTSLLCSINASAAPVSITYDGQYHVGANDYATLADLVTAKAAQIEADGYDVDNASIAAFLNDLIDTPANQTDFYNFMVNLSGGPLAFTNAEFTEGMQKVKAAKDYGYNILDYVDLNNLTEASIAEAINVVNDAYEADNSFTDMKATLAALEANLGAADATFQALVTKKAALIAKGNAITEAEEAELSATINEIYGNAKMSEFRLDEDTQAIFAARVNAIQNLVGNGSATAVAKADTATDALIADMGNFLVGPTTITSLENLPAVQQSDAATTDGMLSTTAATFAVIDNRMTGFLGQAAGDPLQTYGAWVKGTYSTGTQKAFSLTPGYKFTQKGVTIGLDTGDENMIGIAYSFFKDDIKNKTNAATKDKITAHVGSIYGQYSFNPNVFVSGQFQYGCNFIKKARETGIAGVVATAKPKGNMLAAKAAVGYVFDAGSNVSLIPTLGIAHNNVTVKGYTETATALGRTVGKRSATRTSAIVGVTAKYNSDMGGSMKIVPEIHANLDYAFKGKNAATDISLINGLVSFATPAQKLPKALYNLGGSVMLTNSEKFDVTAGYDFGCAKKFRAHTVNLKLRANF